MYPRNPMGTCRECLGIRGVRCGNHWVRVFWNTAPVVWYTVAVGTALTPQITRIFDYNACPVFCALLVVELLKYGCAPKPQRFAGWELRRTLRAQNSRTLHPCVCHRDREDGSTTRLEGGKKYLDAEVSFTSLKYEQIRPAVLPVPTIETSPFGAGIIF